MVYYLGIHYVSVTQRHIIRHKQKSFFLSESEWSKSVKKWVVKGHRGGTTLWGHSGTQVPFHLIDLPPPRTVFSAASVSPGNLLEMNMDETCVLISTSGDSDEHWCVRNTHLAPCPHQSGQNCATSLWEGGKKPRRGQTICFSKKMPMSWMHHFCWPPIGWNIVMWPLGLPSCREPWEM